MTHEAAETNCEPGPVNAGRSNRLARASVAHPITESDRTITLYRFFGMLQISSVGFLPLSIWASYFRQVKVSTRS